MAVLWKLVACLPLSVAMFVFLTPIVVREIDRSRGYLIPEADSDFPEELMDQFRLYDSDGDGQISPAEFVELITEVLYNAASAATA